MEVRIDLAANAASRATFRVSYTVRGARWAPLYDARLDSGTRERKPALELVRRAEIVQQTGEDWTDVALSVSTVRTAKGGSGPELRPLIVRYSASRAPVRGDLVASLRIAWPARRNGRRTPSAAANEADNVTVVRRPALRLRHEQEAAVETGGYQAVFRVPGRVSGRGERRRQELPHLDRDNRTGAPGRARRRRSTRRRTSKRRSSMPTKRRCCPAASRSIATASLSAAVRWRSRRRMKRCGSASARTTR